MITDKSDVELFLRRAQFAILHPDVEQKKIIGLSTKQMKSGIKGSKYLQFSRNVVCVDIHGPEMTDLSFIDLPGES